ncbi:uncharacterized protein LOC119163913 [Rhipicephalus microplus]|uniref:uncharacterized protein LOC119163913 n=1 Tax=Rhipicephalus microplus TaxID=6941 RepID=UPI003F6AC2C5
MNTNVHRFIVHLMSRTALGSSSHQVTKDVEKTHRESAAAATVTMTLGWSTHSASKDGEKSQHGRRHHCNSCNYETDKVSHMKRHVWVHTGERPFQCHLCPQSFSVKSNLVVHLLGHKGERPHMCHLCPQSFSQKFNLVVHLRTHTGE